jgi:MYXO-CTERM domain-containing protein
LGHADLSAVARPAGDSARGDRRALLLRQCDDRPHGVRAFGLDLRRHHRVLGADGTADSGDETDPNVADTDGGGTDDGDELDAGTDPLDPSDDIPVVDDDTPKGCGCRSAGAPGYLVTLLALGLARRRSRRRRYFATSTSAAADDR